MSNGNATDSYKVTASFTQTKPKRIAFGPPSPHLPAIAEIATDTYDARLAYIMAVVSAWSYADERALAEKLIYYGIEGARIRRIAVQNNALLVVATAYFIQSPSGRFGILAFRGTDPASFITILADGEAMQRPFAGGGVHSGFYANVEALWDDVTECLEAAREGAHIEDDQGTRTQLAQPLEALYVTGHSLGGAMAVLAAARLFGSGYDATWIPQQVVKGVYTFGQPMVGDKAFADGCEEAFGPKLFRHVYRHDVVPHLPPASELDYRHTGRERRSSAVNDGWKEGYAPSARASLAGALVEVGFNAVEARLAPSKALGGLSIDDHMPASYLDVSRYVVDPTSVANAVTRRSWLPPWLPHDLGATVRSLFAGNGGRRSSGRPG